eukprot:TRINITY_DN9145_c0_g1_i1.p1 TRINITY_DN9145_c0_g1~~TRINITY_DN9145_c0_g1_i1.p1  ORF type:complete len:746 (+),score=155.02 TRINITY_DN9145_c0_g1_i1:68-2305(+)
MESHSFENRQREIYSIAQNDVSELKESLMSIRDVMNSGQAYLNSLMHHYNVMKQFASDLGKMKVNHVVLDEKFEICGDSFDDMAHHFLPLIDTMKRFCDPLHSFPNGDLGSIESSLSQYEELIENYDVSFEKEYKGKRLSQPVEDLKDDLAICSKDFFLEMKKESSRYQLEVFKRVRSCTTGHVANFRKCHDTAIQLFENIREQEILNNLHDDIDREDYDVEHYDGDLKQGYIELQVGKQWKLHWMTVDRLEITLYKRWKNTVHEDKLPLELCNIKPNLDIPLSFTILCAKVKEKYIFKCNYQEEMNKWMDCITEGIASSLVTTNEEEISNQAFIEAIWNSHISNRFCADCCVPDPTWVSINTGAKLCIKCSGVHRGLGAHITKVRSLGMDKFEESVKNFLFRVTNDDVNDILVDISPDSLQMTPNFDDTEERRLFIKLKYQDHFFLKASKGEELNDQMIEGIKANDLHMVMDAVFKGANPKLKIENKRNMLHLAAGKNVNISVFLLLNGAKVNGADEAGKSPLMFAYVKGNLKLVIALCEWGADVENTDPSGYNLVEIGEVLTMKGHKIKNMEMMNKFINAFSQGDSDIIKQIQHKSMKKKSREIDCIIVQSQDTCLEPLLYESTHSDTQSEDSSTRLNSSRSFSSGRKALTRREDRFYNIDRNILISNNGLSTSSAATIGTPPQSARSVAVSRRRGDRPVPMFARMKTTSDLPDMSKRKTGKKRKTPRNMSFKKKKSTTDLFT